MCAAALLAPAAAAADEGATGIGVGAEAMLTGPTGASVVYDAARFRVSGVLGFVDDGVDAVGIGARFVWVMHRGDAADFGVGGGIGVVNEDAGGGMADDDRTNVHIELMGQLRAFLTRNVALSASFGASAIAGDNDGFAFGGQLVGSLGAHYFFW
ncbi:MAG: hypothetical protein D6689_03000 [Deltaproteobacteria bacterium]|nr:MAG: hypothetical protein D6689_03000 [Deltaproteobacteria bacterium]